MPAIESVRQDLRFAVRHFARQPLSALTIVLVLALGIGVHSAVFSLVQSLTTRPAPGVPRSSSLVRIRGRLQQSVGATWMPRGLSYAEFTAIVADRGTFAAAAAWSLDDIALSTGSGQGALPGRAQFVTSGYFTTLGVRPALGTVPANGDDAVGAAHEAVIGDALWHTMFGASPSAVGAVVRVNGVAMTIVGVMPPRFNGATPNDGDRMLWLPLGTRADVLASGQPATASADSGFLQAVARVNTGVPVATASARATVMSERMLSQLAPVAGIATRNADVVALAGDTDLPANGTAAMYAVVYGSVALLILLIACTNVSALVIGAATTRRHEIAVRLSLGASRARLVRQLLTESMLLAIVGGGLGLALYAFIVQFVATRVPSLDLAPDFATIAYTMAFALGTGVLFGLSPALHATRGSTAGVLKDSGLGSRSRSRLQRSFVVAQIVLTQPLLVGLAFTLGALQQDSSGATNDAVATHVLSVRFGRGAGSSQVRDGALQNALAQIRETPGVTSVVAEPFGTMVARFAVATKRGDATLFDMQAHVEATRPGYFAALGIPLLAGRDVALEDSTLQDMQVVVGSDLARQLWGTVNPIGERLVAPTSAGKPPLTAIVVGVFDARIPTTRGSQDRLFAMRAGAEPSTYLVRTSAPAAAVLPEIRGKVASNLSLPLERLLTLADVERDNRASALQVSAGVAAAGGLTLLMAAIGLYGVVALAFGQRRREIGVRIALGARPRQVVTLLFANGLKLSALGLVLGLPLSIAAFRVFAGMVVVPDISMTAVGSSVALVVLAVSSLAAFLPARSAATVDPVTALRAD